MEIFLHQIAKKNGRRVLLLIVVMLIAPIKMVSSENFRSDFKSQPTLQSITPIFDFCTYFGGNDLDEGEGIAITEDGSCYIAGSTESADFPTKNAYNDTLGGPSDIFISKFSANGSLIWSTFFGGNSADICWGIGTSNDGSCYITGITYSNNFPTLNAYNDAFGGIIDAYVAKFSSTGALLWSTYLGGYSYDQASDIAVTSEGDCFVVGYTNSPDFPIMNAFDDSIDFNDIFITKFSSTGSLLMSTFLGGSFFETATGIAVSDDGSCYISGFTNSHNFPIFNAFDNEYNGGAFDTFVAKFSPSGSIAWSTYLGGSNREYERGIAVDKEGSCYITGFTESNNFPVMKAYDSTFNGGDNEAYITKFSTSGTLLWSTFFGGNDLDSGVNIAVTEDGICYVLGITTSDDLPTLTALNDTLNGVQDIFIAEFSSAGKLQWSTFLGGSSLNYGEKIALTNNGTCFIVGFTTSDDFPTKNAYDNTWNGDADVIVMKITDTIPLGLSSKGFYFFLLIIPIIPIVIIIIRRRGK